jgi:hypothetical protein
MSTFSGPFSLLLVDQMLDGGWHWLCRPKRGLESSLHGWQWDLGLAQTHLIIEYSWIGRSEDARSLLNVRHFVL